jgi:hypothetical protein
MMRETRNGLVPADASFSRMSFGRGLADSRQNQSRLKKVEWHVGFLPMKLTLVLCGLLALLMPGPAKGQAGAGVGMKNAVILVIRHGEKPDQGTGLSDAGKKRAKAYVRYFKHLTVDSTPLKVDYLYAAADSKASHRPRLTLEPFSKAVGLQIDSEFQESHVQQLAEAIQGKPPGKQFLICWHHTEIPRLLRALGGDPEALLSGGKWPDDVFGWVIQLRYDPAGHLTEAKRISENLMPDDSGQ